MNFPILQVAFSCGIPQENIVHISGIPIQTTFPAYFDLHFTTITRGYKVACN